MNCPKCQHEHFVKNGHVNEKQRLSQRSNQDAERALAVKTLY